MSFKSIAESYLIAGLNPLPLRENKAPNLPKGHKFLYELNENLLNFDSIDTKKIGIACGVVSENLLCIDFDKHQGQDVRSIFKKYIECSVFNLLVNLKKVSIYETPSGGFHIIFRTDIPFKGTTLSRYEDGNIMIETRGDGQYIAAFPSEGYKFISGCDLTELRKLDPEECEFLLDRAKIFNRDLSNVKKKTGSLLTDDQRKWPEEWPTNTPDGIFNNTGVDHVKKLLNEKGWNLSNSTKADDKVEYWIRPNKLEEDGISATFGFKKNMFYVFTDSPDIYPLEKDNAYSPFMLLVLLEYNGDWKQAKDDLRETYGLTSIKPLPKIEDDAEIEDINFPLEIFPDDYQSYILETNKTLTYSKDYIACTMLSTIATCIGNKVKIKIKNGYVDSPIFWFAIVGSRGANKTHPVSSVLNPFKIIENNSFIKYKAEILNYNSLKEDDKNKIIKPQFKQIMVSDFTIEALYQILSFNKKGVLLYKDELVGFFKDMNKYKKSGGDEEFFLESFNNGSFTINRKTQDTLRLDKININIIGTIQDEVLMQLAGNHTENGLIDRFLFTKSEKLAKPLTKEDLPPEYIQWWNEKVKQINSELKYIDDEDTIICEMNDDAFEYLLQIENTYTFIQNNENTLSSLQTYYSKLRTYVKRFSLLLMILEHFDYGTELIVTIDHLKKAELLIEYFAKTASNVFTENIKIKEKKEVFDTLKGKTTVEKIVGLHKKGFKNVEIAKMTGKSKPYITKVLKENDKLVN
jgi:hypothetical protein